MFRFSKLFISLFGVGFIPLAPGTIASFVTIIFFYNIINYVSLLTLILIFFILFFISIKQISIYSLNKENNDSKEIVIDEFLGIYLILLVF